MQIVFAYNSLLSLQTRVCNLVGFLTLLSLYLVFKARNSYHFFFYFSLSLFSPTHNINLELGGAEKGQQRNTLIDIWKFEASHYRS